MRTANGSEVRALARDDLDVRGSVLFMVRPESLSLLSPADQADNVLQGTLREAIMVGGVTKYYVEITDDLVIAVNTLTGIVTLTGASRSLASSDPSLGRDAGALPNHERCGSKLLEHRSFEEVTLVVEGVVGRRMDGEEGLRRAG